VYYNKGVTTSTGAGASRSHNCCTLCTIQCTGQQLRLRLPPLAHKCPQARTNNQPKSHSTFLLKEQLKFNTAVFFCLYIYILIIASFTSEHNSEFTNECTGPRNIFKPLKKGKKNWSQTDVSRSSHLSESLESRQGLEYSSSRVYVHTCKFNDTSYILLVHAASIYMYPHVLCMYVLHSTKFSLHVHVCTYMYMMYVYNDYTHHASFRVNRG